MPTARPDQPEGEFFDGRAGVATLRRLNLVPTGPMPLTPADFRALMRGEGPPAICLRGYLPKQLTLGWADAVSGYNFRAYSVTEGDSGGAAYYCGPNLYDTAPVHDGVVDYSPYFVAAEAGLRQLADTMRIFNLPHPIDDVLAPLAEDLHEGPVELAQEGEGQPYFAGVVRSISNGIHHHVDNGPLEAPELIIGTTTAQASVLIYLDTPGDGSGALNVFHKEPSQLDYILNRHPSYGFTPDAVNDAGVTRIVPEAGDVVIFNARHIHAVEPSTPGTRRITISTFFGLLPDGRLVMWS
jgi:hypothetical protein